MSNVLIHAKGCTLAKRETEGCDCVAAPAIPFAPPPTPEEERNLYAAWLAEQRAAAQSRHKDRKARRTALLALPRREG